MKSLIAASLVAATALPAAAQFQKPEDAIKYRQSVMTVMAAHFGRVAAMAQGKVPFDAKAAADNAAIVVTMSQLPWIAFSEGMNKGLPNRARPEIWSQNAKFKELAQKLQVEITKFDAAARSGNPDTIKSSVGAVGGTCKSCHDDFQAEKYSAN